MNDDIKTRVHAYTLRDAPGHLIRRCQQRAVDYFVDEVGENGPTPRQFAVLLNVFQNPGMSQTELVRESGIDRSTLTEILRRMIERGLVSRSRLKEDKRANALTLTPDGEAMLATAFDAVQRAQERILEPVPAPQRGEVMEMLEILAGYTELDVAQPGNKPDADA